LEKKAVTGSKKQLLAPRVKSLFQNSRMPKNQDKYDWVEKNMVEETLMGSRTATFQLLMYFRV
jgi:hypothetical protein